MVNLLRPNIYFPPSTLVTCGTLIFFSAQFLGDPENPLQQHQRAYGNAERIIISSIQRLSALTSAGADTDAAINKMEQRGVKAKKLANQLSSCARGMRTVFKEKFHPTITFGVGHVQDARPLKLSAINKTFTLRNRIAPV